MEYAQLNVAGTEAIQIPAHHLVEWDENNLCRVEALVADGKDDQFRIVQLSETSPPTHDPMTQAVIRDGCELVDGEWCYKWRIDNLDADAIEALRKAKVPVSVSMRQAELALLAAGLLDDIEALIPSLPREDQISWKRASMVERNNPLVAYVQAANSLTDTQIDDLFVAAAGL